MHNARLAFARCPSRSPQVILAVAVWVSAAGTTLFAAEVPKEKPKGAEKDAEGWTSLFDGKALGKWEVLEKFDYKDHGLVHVQDGCLVLDKGQTGTGVRWTGPFPKTDYEISLEAKRVDGNDFFCGLTFPVGDTALTLIMGGWGGWVVGLSCIDGYSAVDNETCQAIQFAQDRWYRVRVHVTRAKIQIWIDDKETITLEPKNRKLNVRWEMEPCQPLGIATWWTTGSLRNIRYRELAPEPKQP
jgi:hypothetical protein